MKSKRDTSSASENKTDQSGTFILGWVSGFSFEPSLMMKGMNEIYFLLRASRCPYKVNFLLEKVPGALTLPSRISTSSI